MAEKPRVATFYGGVPEEDDRKLLKDPNASPHIVVGTPGRIKAVSMKLFFSKRLISNDVKATTYMFVCHAASAEESSQAFQRQTLCAG